MNVVSMYLFIFRVPASRIPTPALLRSRSKELLAVLFSATKEWRPTRNVEVTPSAPCPSSERSPRRRCRQKPMLPVNSDGLRNVSTALPSADRSQYDQTHTD